MRSVVGFTYTIKGPCHHYYRESLENPPQALHQNILFLWTTEQIGDTSHNCGDLSRVRYFFGSLRSCSVSSVGEKYPFLVGLVDQLFVEMVENYGSRPLIFIVNNTWFKYTYGHKHYTCYVFEKKDREVNWTLKILKNLKNACKNHYCR